MIGTLNLSINRGERADIVAAVRGAYIQARAMFAVAKATAEKQDPPGEAPDFLQHLTNALLGDGEAVPGNDVSHPGGANLDSIFAAANFAIELQKHLREAPDTGALVQVVKVNDEAMSMHIHVTYGVPLVFDDPEPAPQPGFMPN